MGAFLRNRMLWTLISTSLSCFFLVYSSPGQITFERTYGGIEEDVAKSVQQTLDGGYIVVGWTFGGVDGMAVYLIKTDSLGEVLWEMIYGETFWYEGNSVQQTSDGGYVVAGCRGVGFGDIYLLKTDSLGNVLWDTSYDASSDDNGFSVRQTTDGGYVVAGCMNCEVADSGDVYVIKTDSLGNVLWDASYGGMYRDWGKSVQQTPDRGYIVAGWTFGGGDVYLVRTDSLGNLVWDRSWGPTSVDMGFGLDQTTDGGYVVSGCSNPPGGIDVYLSKTDSLGNVMWGKTYEGGGFDTGNSVQETADRGYIIAGDASATDTGDVYLVKTDSLGDSLWARRYGGGRGASGSSVQQTTDGGYIIAGCTRSFGAGRCDVYLIKTNADGLVARDVAVVSLDAPVDTVFTDSTYQVRATVENLLPGFPSLDVVATIDGYADTFRVVGLPPESLFQVTFENWQVPSADSVTYTMTVCTHAEGDIDTTNNCSQKSIFAYSPVGIGESPESGMRGLRFELGQNKPNPFEGRTAVWYCIPTNEKVSLAVYDIAGRLVETLVSETRQPGIHQVRWDRDSNPSGVYFYQFRAGEFVETRKMVVVE